MPGVCALNLFIGANIGSHATGSSSPLPPPRSFLCIPSLSIFLCLPDGICIMRHVAEKWQQLRVAISVTTLALCCAILYTRCYARLHIYSALKKILEDVDRAELQLELGG